MNRKISEHIEWVGKTDWELTHFHGEELSTAHGSSYNAYLVRCGGKTVPVDTVWRPYDREFVERLAATVDLHDIDFIVMNHNEVDHSGALPELMAEIPGTPIYCTAKGESIIRGHYHPEGWDIRTVRTGDRIALGDESLTFIEAPMLHWPDTMFTYFSGDGGVLFSNDAFGQHYATESLFEDRENLEGAIREALKYYVNILTPFSAQVGRKLVEIGAMNLPLALVAPSHGVIWREHIPMIMELYKAWSGGYAEERVAVVYDTMWNSTRRMAEAIADGIAEVAPRATVTLHNASKHDKNDIVTEVFRSKALVMGCPTINNELSYAVDGLLGMIKGLKLKGKSGAAFGSYGWSGEGPGLIQNRLEAAGFAPVCAPLRLQWVPDAAGLEECRAFGRGIGSAVFGAPEG